MLKTIKKLFKWVITVDNKEKSYVKVLNEAQEKNPNIVLPSMGILENSKKIDIKGKDYIKRSDKDAKS